MFIRRPKRGETEDDLLKFQEEYLASSSKPSVKVVKRSHSGQPATKPASESDSVSEACSTIKPTDPASTTSRVSKDVVDMGQLPDSLSANSSLPPPKKGRIGVNFEDSVYKSSQDAETIMELSDNHITKVLTDIVEKEISNTPVYYPTMPQQLAFPNVLHRGKTCNEVKKGKKKSLFAQQFERQRAQDFGVVRRPKIEVSSTLNKTGPVEETSNLAPSSVITGKGLDCEDESREVQKIHEENVAFLTNLSEIELLQEQRELMQSLDPSLVAFLKQKKSSIRASDTVASESKKDKSDEKAPKPSTGKIKSNKNWVHMDKGEPEKMEWMNDLPSVKLAQNTKTGQQVRFDFQGLIVSGDSEIPVHLGLHHHGDEPERAGYTLGELFHLARSANIQQRCMALQIISKILENGKLGQFHEMVKPSVLPSLLDSGIVFIIRWALDDSTEGTVAAAVKCLKSLLVNDADEEAADQVLNWPHGHSMPGLLPEKDYESTDEETNPTDAQLLKEDLVKGLLKMSILPRLRYILEVMRPAASVTLNILDILTRIVRHSSETAYEVLQCPRLLNNILNEFMPTVWEPVEKRDDPMTFIHGLPVSNAVKLIRLVCTSGRHMTANLISTQGVMNRIARYLAEKTEDLQLHHGEGEKVQLESVRLWTVCALYGLADVNFQDLYPIMTKALQGLVGETQCDMDSSCFLPLLEAYTFSACPTNQEKEGLSLHLHWSQVSGFLQPVQTYMERGMKAFIDSYVNKDMELSGLACAVNFVASHLSCLSNQTSFNVVSVLQWVEKLCIDALKPLLESMAFKIAIKRLRKASIILEHGDRERIRKDIPRNIPELGVIIDDDGEKCSICDIHSPFSFMISICRLLRILGKIHKDVIPQLFGLILDDADIVSYVRNICKTGHKANTLHCAFLKYENLLQHHLLSLCKVYQSKEVGLYHQMALFLMSRSHHGEEHMVHDLLSTVVLSETFIPVESAQVAVMQGLDIQDRSRIGTAAGNKKSMTEQELQSDIISRLPSIRATYLDVAAAHSKKLLHSRSLALHFPKQTQKLTLADRDDLLLPADWFFLPILHLYSIQQKTDVTKEESISPEMVVKVTNVLRWLYFLETRQPHVVDSMSAVMKLSRLCCVFLAGSDLFLDPAIHCYLEALLKLYSKPIHLNRLNFSEVIPGVTSFLDLYTSLLVQYEAVSFGDELFACYLLYPLQQQQPVGFRRALWGEHATLLPSFRVTTLESSLPITAFLEPVETNLEMLNLYFRALFSGAVHCKRNPLLYLIAVHHLNRYVYSNEDKNSKLRLAMLKQIVKGESSQLKHHLIMYNLPNVDKEFGFELFEDLPLSREKTVNAAKELQ